MGRLTTHVLDTAHGCPASSIVIDLIRITSEGDVPLKSIETNSDGRSDAPLLEGEALTGGIYELRFHVGAYFAGYGSAPSDLQFLDVVPVRFSVSDTDEHYHVPLLVSPFGYSTYRGS